MALELNDGLDFRLDRILAVHQIKILFLPIRSHALELIVRVNAALRLCQDFDIEIARKDPMLDPRRHLLHDDGQGIGLGADGAAGTPDIELRRPLQQIRNDIRFQFREFFRRTEKFRHVDGQILDEFRKIVLVLGHHIKISRIGIHAAPCHEISDAPLHLRFFIKIQINFCFCLQFLLKRAPVLLIHDDRPSKL